MSRHRPGTSPGCRNHASRYPKQRRGPVTFVSTLCTRLSVTETDPQQGKAMARIEGEIVIGRPSMCSSATSLTGQRAHLGLLVGLTKEHRLQVQAAVHLAAVSHHGDGDRAGGVVHVVDDPVIAHPDSQPGPVSF